MRTLFAPLLLGIAGCSGQPVVINKATELETAAAVVDEATREVIGKTMPGTMAVGYAIPNRTALDPVFPVMDRWVVRAVRVWPPSKGRLEIRLDEGRLNDAEIASGCLDLAGPIDLLLCFRIDAIQGWQNTAAGEVVIATCDGNQLTIIARVRPAAGHLPSGSAVERGLLDTSLDHATGGNLNIDLGEWRRVVVVSWNGQSSSHLADVRRPDYSGGISMMVGLDDDTQVRTAGLLPQWPEALWFLRVRLMTGS